MEIVKIYKLSGLMELRTSDLYEEGEFYFTLDALDGIKQ